MVVGYLGGNPHVHGISPFFSLKRKPLSGLCADDAVPRYNMEEKRKGPHSIMLSRISQIGDQASSDW